MLRTGLSSTDLKLEASQRMARHDVGSEGATMTKKTGKDTNGVQTALKLQERGQCEKAKEEMTAPTTEATTATPGP
jgi:hypothetical protein